MTSVTYFGKWDKEILTVYVLIEKEFSGLKIITLLTKTGHLRVLFNSNLGVVSLVFEKYENFKEEVKPYLFRNIRLVLM